MAYKNLYVPDAKNPRFVAWKNAIEAGHIPGNSASARLLTIVERDLKAFAHKLLKAGVKVPPVVEAATNRKAGGKVKGGAK